MLRQQQKQVAGKDAGRVFGQRCLNCSKNYDIQRHVTRCKCGGLIEFEYNLNSLGASNWVDQSKKIRGLIRFWRLLPLTGPSTLMPEEYLFPPTPLYRSKGLGELLRLKELWIKDETRNPSKSFKARDAFVSVSRFREIGLEEFVLCSTGNTAAAFCYMIRFGRTPMKMHIFLPKGTLVDFPTSSKYVPCIEFVDGSYQEAINRAQAYASEKRLAFEGGFGNPCRREGSKTLSFELGEAKLRAQWYVQSIGSGTGAYGFHKGFSQLKGVGVVTDIPKILCVQPENCSPIVDAFRRGREELSPEDLVQRPATIACTLANGNPTFSYPYVRKAVVESHGSMEKVTEEEIHCSMRLLNKYEKILAEPAAAVALAGLIRSVEKGVIDRDSTIVLNVSGGLRRNGRKQELTPSGRKNSSATRCAK